MKKKDPKKIQPFFEAGRTAQRADLLFELIHDLNINYIFERSFKMFEKTLLGNRFLFGILKNTIKQNPHEKLLNICQRMDMPDGYLKTFRKNLSDAQFIHFGFEENKNASIYKAYLEFPAKLDQMAKTDPDRSLSLLNKSEPLLMFFGFKWNADDNSKRVLTEYVCYPSLSFEKILGRLSAIFENDTSKKPLEIATDFLDIVSTRITHEKINYFDVIEKKSKRRSFDINVYEANLQLEELYPLLSKMCRHYSISSRKFQILYDRYRSRIVGHLSGGIGGNGKDFLTVYFGGKDSLF